jgi:hypothetical protein
VSASPLCVFVFLFAAIPAAAKAEFFPKAGEIFAPLLADPNQPRLSASYYRLQSEDQSDLAVGGAVGLARARVGGDLSWLGQLETEAMARTRIGRNGRTEAADLSAALPISFRRGDVSFKTGPFYRGADSGLPRFSEMGLRALAALEPWPALRVYGGTSFLLHTAPSAKRWGLQAGIELTSPEIKPGVRLYLAEDLQFHERVGFNPNYRFAAGVQRGALRVQVGRFNGHSAYGRFFSDREHYTDLTIMLKM